MIKIRSVYDVYGCASDGGPFTENCCLSTSDVRWLTRNHVAGTCHPLAKSNEMEKLWQRRMLGLGRTKSGNYSWLLRLGIRYFIYYCHHHVESKIILGKLCLESNHLINNKLKCQFAFTAIHIPCASPPTLSTDFIYKCPKTMRDCCCLFSSPIPDHKHHHQNVNE